MRDIVVASLRSKGYKVHLSGIQNECNLCCPFCILRGKTEDTEYKLGLNTSKGWANCFRCHWKSRNALEQLDVALSSPGFTEKVELAEPVELPEDFELLQEHSKDEWMQRAYQYVLDRGISKEQIQKHCVGLSLTGKYRARVLFPIWQRRTLLGFSGRVLTDQKPKWLHSVHLTAPYPVATQGRKKEIVLVEGICDALVVGRWLGDQVNAMSLLGTHLTEEKLKWLRFYDQVSIWFDPDTAGRTAVMEVAPLLQELGKQVRIIHSMKDPSDLQRDDIVQVFQNRQKWSEKEGTRLLLGV